MHASFSLFLQRTVLLNVVHVPVIVVKARRMDAAKRRRRRILFPNYLKLFSCRIICQIVQLCACLDEEVNSLSSLLSYIVLCRSRWPDQLLVFPNRPEHRYLQHRCLEFSRDNAPVVARFTPFTTSRCESDFEGDSRQ